ncbi:MAG TPA: hydroxymethylbilane synthase [Candidatus Brocadiia bacterium]|nr:hydroxymethylbilane synthase [Candidatus Brocadiales bacterium]
MAKTGRIIIGSRGSKLALVQSNWVKSELERCSPGIEVTIEKISTTGDKITDVPLSRLGGKGLFTKELEVALLERRIDLAVHSMKDLPTEVPEGLTIGAVSKREDPHDILISKKNVGLRELPEGARVGTSSLRRRAQLLAIRPDLVITDLRGNLDTRLKKLDTTDLDAIVVARAGVLRLGFKERATQIIPFEELLPAVGQGALCVEIRANDGEVKELVTKAINDPATSCAVEAERALLAELEGGCQIPIGAVAQVTSDDKLELEAIVCSLDGKVSIRDKLTGTTVQAKEIGYKLARKLLSMGADKLLAQIRQSLEGKLIPSVGN